METTFDAVIIANGAFPTHAAPLNILHHAAHLIACDGAVIRVPHADIVIGDGDSVPAEYHNRLLQINEQEDNDLTKATRYCLSHGWHKIAYLGCTGKREDHTLGNISLLMRYFRDMNSCSPTTDSLPLQRVTTPSLHSKNNRLASSTSEVPASHQKV